MTESAANHPNRFLADLTQAMRSTAEMAKLSNVEQGRDNARVYVEQLRARSLLDAEDLRKSAESDVATIRERSKAQVDRVRHETEDRIARRRELLDQELQDYTAAVGLELERTNARVEAYKSEVDRFFEKILVGDDPSLLASMASQMPEPPPFVELDRESLAHELQAERQMAEAAERGETAPANAPDAPKEKLPDHWWLDSPSKLSARKKDENPG